MAWTSDLMPSALCMSVGVVSPMPPAKSRVSLPPPSVSLAFDPPQTPLCHRASPRFDVSPWLDLVSSIGTIACRSNAQASKSSKVGFLNMHCLRWPLCGPWNSPSQAAIHFRHRSEHISFGRISKANCCISDLCQRCHQLNEVGIHHVIFS